jgi:hypothetical protein
MKAPGDAELRMARAGEGLGPGETLLLEVDLRLIPELDPVAPERFAEPDTRRDGDGMTELEPLHDPVDGRSLERLLERRQHLELLLVADALHVAEHGRAPTAHQLHEAGIAALGEHQDGVDRFARLHADVDEHEVGIALGDQLRERLSVGELQGVDARAMQNERQEMADARVGVDDEARRDAPALAVRFRHATGVFSRYCTIQTVGHLRACCPYHVQPLVDYLIQDY